MALYALTSEGRALLALGSKTEQRAHLELGSAALADVEDFATAAQGALAASAVQPGDIGSSATHASIDFATSAQGALADSAVQPGDLGSAASHDAADFESALPLATAAKLILTSTAEGGKTWEEQAPGGVTSVAGRTGDITLSTADVSGLGDIASHDTSEFQVATETAAQVEMELGTETASRMLSPLRVAQAIAALAPSGTILSDTTPAYKEGAIWVDTSSAGTLKERVGFNGSWIELPYGL